MIQSEADFEAALEEVVDLLDRPFTAAGGDRLSTLLDEIQTWKPELATRAPEDTETAQQREALQEHLKRFERDLRMHHPNVMTDLGAKLRLFEDAPEPRRELGDPHPDLSNPNGIGG